MKELWVFGYGSLMWRPGFSFSESHVSYAYGYHRALCIRSWVHRGTRDNPGLVLGLNRGGSCKGVSFRVEAADHDEVVEYLRARELVTAVYVEKMVPVKLADGRRVEALTYVADRTHEQYASGLHTRDAAEMVHRAKGQSGGNIDYVTSTVEHLRQLGINDHNLESVLREVRELSR